MSFIKSLYIHIPFCVSKCSYCDFFSVPCIKNKIPDEYIYALENEFNFYAKKYNLFELETVYVGGGTPSILSFSQISKLFSIVKNFLKKDCEITFEMNPDDVSAELLNLLWKCGVNRISVGIQSFSEASLQYVKRRASAFDSENALNIIKQNWHGKISCDMICALPFETERDFLKNLEKLVSYNVHHISLYSLAIEEGTALHKEIVCKKIKYDEENADKMWISGVNFLKQNGYEHYEVSNFYKIEDGTPCFHNMKYWDLKSYIGIGSGAASSVYEECVRHSNTTDIEKYIKFWRSDFENQPLNLVLDFENLDEKTQKFEFLMMGLRLLRGVCIDEYKKRFCVSCDDKFFQVFYKWEAKGMAFRYKKNENEYFTLGEKGLLFLNVFLEELL